MPESVLKPSDVLAAQFRHLGWDEAETARRLGAGPYGDYRAMMEGDGLMTSRLGYRLEILTGVRMMSWLLLDHEYRAERLEMEALV